MKLINRYLTAASIAIIGLFACQDETLTFSDALLGLEFYPVEEGRSWTYRMDSTLIVSGGNTILNTSSYVREEIVNSFINGSGDTTFVLSISKSPTIDGPYRTTNTWAIEKSNSRVIRIEENLGFLKLAFPIREGNEADNTFFDQQIKVDIAQQQIQPYKGWRYKVLSRGNQLNVAGEQFINVTTISQANNQEDFINDLEQRLVIEHYAPNVGLLSRSMEIFNTQCGTPCRDEAWIDKAEEGFSLVQTLVEYN